MSARKVYLACVGDATHPDAWSAIPYHFLAAAKPLGLINEGLPLQVDTRFLKIARYFWNLRNIILGRGRGGFQYSSTFLNAIWKNAADLSGSVIINHFQIYPAAIRRDDSIDKWFYVDGTLRLLCDDYGVSLPPKLLARVIEDEREGYHRARGIITMSRYAARNVVEHYGVPAEKVHVVIPGANILEPVYADLEKLIHESHAHNSNNLRLLVIGKEFHRKGIDLLLEALLKGRKRGLRATLRIVGCPRESAPPHLADISGVEWNGFVSRRSDADRFFRLVTECDFGCLLSRAEMAGIAVREYLALGMPVIASNAGGCPEMTDPDCCRIVDVNSSPDAIAELLLELQNKPELVRQMKSIAMQRRRTRLWDSTVHDILKFWPYTS